MGFRPTLEVRTKLEAAARASSRSLSQEIESRLERSLDKEEDEYTSFGGKHVYALARVVSAAVMAAESQTGKRWQEDNETYLQAKLTIDRLLDGLGPTQPGQIAEGELIERAEALVSVALSVKSRTARLILHYIPDLVDALESSDEWEEVRKGIRQRQPSSTIPTSKTA